MRHSKRIEALFNELGIEVAHDYANIKKQELTNLCRKYNVKKSRVLLIADGSIKQK